MAGARLTVRQASGNLWPGWFHQGSLARLGPGVRLPSRPALCPDQPAGGLPSCAPGASRLLQVPLVPLSGT